METDKTPQQTDEKDSKSPNIATIILVLLILALAGALLWFVILDKEKAPVTNQVAKTNGDDGNSGLIDPTDIAHWSTVLLGPSNISHESTVIAGLSFKLPIGWTTKDCTGGGDPISYVSPTKDTQATCDSEGGPPITVVIQMGDASDAYTYTDNSVYSDIKSEKVTVGGKQFTLSSATIKNPMEFMPPAGTKLISYFFVKDDVTYSASYTYKTTDSGDLTAEFVKIVEKTLIITTE